MKSCVRGGSLSPNDLSDPADIQSRLDQVNTLVGAHRGTSTYRIHHELLSRM